MDIASRLPRLRERMADAGCDALLVTHLTNIRYLTGFTGSSGLSGALNTVWDGITHPAWTWDVSS